MPQFSDDLFLGSALTVQGQDQYPAVSTFTGSIATTTLTVSVTTKGVTEIDNTVQFVKIGMVIVRENGGIEGITEDVADMNTQRGCL